MSGRALPARRDLQRDRPSAEALEAYETAAQLAARQLARDEGHRHRARSPGRARGSHRGVPAGARGAATVMQPARGGRRRRSSLPGWRASRCSFDANTSARSSRRLAEAASPRHAGGGLLRRDAGRQASRVRVVDDRHRADVDHRRRLFRRRHSRRRQGAPRSARTNVTLSRALRMKKLRSPSRPRARRSKRPATSKATAC